MESLLENSTLRDAFSGKEREEKKREKEYPQVIAGGSSLRVALWEDAPLELWLHCSGEADCRNVPRLDVRGRSGRRLAIGRAKARVFPIVLVGKSGLYVRNCLAEKLIIMGCFN
ncbi:hypothetical protein NPIL_565081 [Nephila pilipes]|uniref:Uncharacterized protein n=1 Tax=Nephila pilipes TaxID=299642 RepID=A0A8X6P6R3_NEPPI|nr:hypothetical protein NPIL_565081 [Nephila pilipes]